MAEHEYTMPRAEFDAPVKLLIVVAPFYRDIADNLIKGAVAEIEATGATHEIAEVPGALELPTAIGIAERMSNFDGYVALGCVIRGETSHYDYICQETARALMDLSLIGVPLGNGILTVESMSQAMERAMPDRKNKGADAANAALRMIELKAKFEDE